MSRTPQAHLNPLLVLQAGPGLHAKATPTPSWLLFDIMQSSHHTHLLVSDHQV